MPLQISQSELDAIVRAIGQFDAPVRADTLNRALHRKLDIRTLQRRLALLVKQQRVIAEGEGPARRYRVQRDNQSQSTQKEGGPDEEVSIPLSAAAQKIRKYVRQPPTRRTPVGYKREFLDKYRPNVTFYLSATLREHLLDIGKPLRQPLPEGTYVKQILNRLLIDLSYNSSRLEGNTYSLLETEQLFEYGSIAEGKNTLDATMILNHKDAIQYLVDHATEVRFNAFTILNLHGLLANNLLDNPRSIGALRKIPVGVGKTVYEPLSIPQVLEECFTQVLATAEAIKDPYEQSFFALIHLSYLQAFEDVNKRVARLAANIPLIRKNLIPLSFVEVPRQAYIDGLLGVYELNHYELMRDVFVWAYERSCARYSTARHEIGEPDPMRLQYRTLIAQTIGEVVRSEVHGKYASDLITTRAMAAVKDIDRARFIEIVESELFNLHEGSIARYQITAEAFEAWNRNAKRRRSKK